MAENDNVNPQPTGGEHYNPFVRPKTVDKVEVDKLPRASFGEVQEEIVKLLSNPTPGMSLKERSQLLDQLWADRRALTKEAKNRDVLKDIEFSVKNAQETIQKGGDYLDLMSKVAQIDVTQMEASAKGASDWDPRFEGMIEEYKNVAVLVMDHAYLEALQGEARRVGNEDRATAVQIEIDERDRLIKMRAWGSIPLDAYALARVYVERKNPNNSDDSGKLFEQLLEVNRRIAEGVEKSGGVEELPGPESDTPEGWIKLIFSNISKLENLSEKNLKKSKEDLNWDKIQRAIDRIPNGLGTMDQLLSAYYRADYENGVYLREKLQVYFDARKSLNDRFVEVKKAKGSLNALAVGSEDQPFEGISYQLTEMSGMHKWVIVNTKNIFEPDVTSFTPQERKEYLPNVDAGMSAWWMVGGVLYDSNTYLDGNGNKVNYFDGMGEVPTYKDSLNNAQNMRLLQAAVMQKTGEKLGTQLADRLFAVWLTSQLWDKDRASVQGKSEPRDLFHFDKKRGGDYFLKGRQPETDYTIMRYWALENYAEDGEDRSQFEKFLDAYKREGLDIGQKRDQREAVLRYNSTHNVFTIPSGYDHGQLVSDFLHTAIPGLSKDILGGKPIYKKLISYAIDRHGFPIPGGWEKIPFFLLGENAYSGYFNYNVKIATVIEQDLTKGGQKPEEIILPQMWNKRIALEDRLDAVSPWFNTLENDFRGLLIRNILNRVGSFDHQDVDKLGSFADVGDLGHFSEEDREEIVSILNEQTNPQGAKRLINDPGTLNLVISNIRKSKENSPNPNEILVKDVIREYAKLLADDFKYEHLLKIRMVSALGVFWNGSLDILEGVGGDMVESPYKRRDVRLAIDAIEQTGYLSGEYLHQLRYEVKTRLRFGKRFLQKKSGTYSYKEE